MAEISADIALMEQASYDEEEQGEAAPQTQTVEILPISRRSSSIARRSGGKG
jgi:hypothetical protein